MEHAWGNLRAGLGYALRRHPLVSDTSLVPTLTGPVDAREFTHRYQAAASDLRYIIQRGTDLSGWTEIYRYDGSTGLTFRAVPRLPHLVVQQVP
jgi:hypothetical protein